MAKRGADQDASPHGGAFQQAAGSGLAAGSEAPQAFEVTGIAQAWCIAERGWARSAEGRYHVEPGVFEGEQPVYRHDQGGFCIRFDATEGEWQLVEMPAQGSHGSQRIPMLKGTGAVRLEKVPEWKAANNWPMPSVRVAQIFLCPVCTHAWHSEKSLSAHIRDKQDPRHDEYRRERADSEKTVKRQRTRASGRTDTPGAPDEGSGQGDVGTASVDVQAKTGGGVTDFVVKSGKAFVKSSKALFMRSSPPEEASGSEGTPVIGPQLPKSATTDGATRSKRPQKAEDMERILSETKRQHADATAAWREQELEYQGRAQELQAEVNRQDMALGSLRQENASLKTENAHLQEQINKWRAASSATARGNDNVSIDFPFNRQIVKSYAQLCDASGDFWALLADTCCRGNGGDPQLDIGWACKVAALVFRETYDTARKHVAEPQEKLREATKAGRGEQEVAEWEPAQVLVTKLQRVTRTRILEGSKDGISAWFKEHLKDPDCACISELMKQGEYIKGSLETCMAKLLEVRCLFLSVFSVWRLDPAAPAPRMILQL